ncbi:MAG: MlaE family lipid ABC transporter permease subunit [Planctomycetota bacterium]|jgi:phospholipid/cholesterol/gamma-HCH transport system permease protein
MTDRPAESEAQLEISHGPEGDLVLRFSGRLDATTIGSIWDKSLNSLRERSGGAVLIEASGIRYCDSAGAALIAAVEKQLHDAGAELRLVDFPENYQPMLDLVRRRPRQKAKPPDQGLLSELGEHCVDLLGDILELVRYTGELFLALGNALLHPRQVRWKAAMAAAQTTGVDSFPVVVLVTGLLGLVMGFQSANLMHNFGADLFLADLLGLSIVRELGPLMTAVVLTARSGSAFAAELGTMKVNEEVDALSTMGINPLRFLVTPRVIAAVLMTPILTIFANIAGLLGGALVWIYTLGLPFQAYANRLMQVLTITDLTGGLIKSFFFGSLIAGVGCLRGMQTEGGAVAVGHSTTRAVVSGIVLIALADTLFAVVFHVLEI